MSMRLLLADDHTLFREALVLYLNRFLPETEIVLAHDFNEAYYLVRDRGENFFDLVILDLCMPGMDGFEGLKAIKNNFSKVPVAIISGIAEPWEIDESLRLGASGFFPKTLTGQALIQAIKTIVSGERFVPTEYTPPPERTGAKKEAFILDEAGRTIYAKDIKLTRREKEVLSYLVQGSSNQDIATELGLKVVTIKLHVRGICQKLFAKNRTQAALRAKELDILNQ